MAYKTDIKDLLENIDLKNRDYFKELSDEEKEGVDPFILLQFLSSGKNDKETEELLLIVNEVLNKDFSLIYKNKELFYKLCCVCGSGSKTFHKFLKPPKSKKTISLLEKLMLDFYGEQLTKTEIKLLLNKNNLFGKEYWIMIAESMSWTNDEIKKLEKEIKSYFKENK